MVYELAVILKDEAGDAGAESVSKIIQEVIKEFKGELLIEDNWGVLSFAQPTSDGKRKGNYLFCLYKADTQINTELNRRFNINEAILNSLIIKVGDDSEAEKLATAYKTPYSKKYKGSVTDGFTEDLEMDMEKDRKKMSKNNTCWFTVKKIRADWKDPKTFSWLINDFGKISPARVSGISRKHQRFATTAIKRARNLGLASSLSNRIAK
jgi:ribosomal protein S18/ribosomal protein S6